MNLYYKLNSQYERTDQVQFRRPTRLGCYAVKKGLNGEKRIVPNIEDFYVKYSLKQFHKLKQLDLKDGFEERPDDRIFNSDGKIDELLQWILSNRHLFRLKDEHTFNGKMRCLNTDFVSFRGTLTLLLCLSYDHKSQFIIHVEKFKETHYMMLERIESEFDVQIPLFCFAGRRFEVYCSEQFSEEDKLKMNPARANESKDKKLSINQTEFERHSTTDLCFIYRSRIDHHSLVYGAEMDSFENLFKLDSVIDSELINGVELKTCKHLDNPRSEATFKKFKTMKWYNQSFLSNVKKVSCGFWRDDHIVDEIKEYTLTDLTEIGSFDSQLCLVQFNKMLAFIKRSFIKQNTNLLKFTYQSFSYKLVCENENVKAVLPDFYKNEFI